MRLQSYRVLPIAWLVVFCLMTAGNWLCGVGIARLKCEVDRRRIRYSIFESQSHGLNQKLRLFAAPDAPVKIAQLRLQNLWERPRRMTVTYYADWVLGTTRDTHQAHIMPEFDADKNALLATNRFNSEFGVIVWRFWHPIKNRMV